MGEVWQEVAGRMEMEGVMEQIWVEVEMVTQEQA